MMQARTMVVLASLVVGMSITSLLLVLLEPNPVSPPPGALLSKQDVSSTSMAVIAHEKIADTAVPMREWTRIVVHDSGATRGSAATLEAAFARLADQRAGYHFVINNGSIEGDGDTEISYRWKHQFDAVDANVSGEGPAVNQFNGTIAVCMIGDANTQTLTPSQEESLFGLVRTLRQQLGQNIVVDFALGDGEAGRQHSRRLEWKLGRDLGRDLG